MRGRAAAGGTTGYAHLHVRSGFSYGYGVIFPEEPAEAAAGAGMDSLAITDRDGLYGVPRFLRASEEAGISPVVGAEISVEGGGYPVGHLVLLAESMAGYRSLCRLITSYRCSSENRRRPLCPLQAVLENPWGLVCLTGAVPFGFVPRMLLGESPGGSSAARGAPRDALRDTVRDLREAFGEGLYVELSDDRTAGSRRRVARVAAFASEHEQTDSRSPRHMTVTRRLSPAFGESARHAAYSARWRSRSNFARPYMLRLIAFNFVT